MIALIVIASIVAYILIGAAFGGWYYANRFKRCEECRRERAGEMSAHYKMLRADCTDMHEGPAILLGFIWPVAGLIVIGMQVGTHFAERDERAEAKRKKEREEYEEAKRILTEAGIEWPEMP